MSALSAALAATLSTNANERHAAEAALLALAANDAHATELLQLAAGYDPLIAAAAALRLKNLMRTVRGVAAPELSPTARGLVRAHILDALAAVGDARVGGVLAETMRWLVLRDFPSAWPDLMTNIQAFLSSGEMTRIYAALVALRQVTKCYQFKSNNPAHLNDEDPNDAGLSQPREPLDRIAEVCFPYLLALYSQLDLIVADTTTQQALIDGTRRKACIAQRLVVKIFWSCSQFILPPFLAEPGILDGWMTAFFETLRRPSLVVQVDEPDDLAQEPDWKTKKWIAQILVRFLKRYRNPKRVPVDEPWAKTVAERFQKNHAERATAVMLEVLSAAANGQQLSKRVANLALDFTEEAVETAALWAVIRPHIDTLLTRVVFPYLCFSAEDEEVWNTDPVEYVRKQYDFTEDFTSTRMAAANLLSRMAELRAKSTALPFLSYLIQAVLEPYHNSAVGSPQRAELARQKVGAFAALAAVKAKLMSKKELSESFLNVLKVHVEPDLRSEFGYLRSESAWLLGQVASAGWDAFSNQMGETALRGCVGLLQDPEMPVQAAAAGALQFLMEQEGAVSLVSPVAPQLLERLLQLMDTMEDGFQSLLPALDKLVERYPDEIMPLARPLLQRLIVAFVHCAQSVLRDEDEDDELVYVASQVLHLISAVLQSVAEWGAPGAAEKAETFASLEEELKPLLESMFNESHQVFAEELMDVLGSLVAHSGELNKGFSPFLLSMIPKMGKAFGEWAADYVEDMMEAIEGYLMFDTQGVLNHEGCMAALVSMVVRLWSANFDESDAIYGTKIANFIILNLCKLRPVPEQVTQEVVVKLARSAAERCVQTPPEQSPLRLRLFANTMNALYFDAAAVVMALGPPAVLQLISNMTSNLDLMDRIYPKKSTVLGVSALLIITNLGLEESKPALLRLLLQLQSRIDAQRSIVAESAVASANRLSSLGANLGNNVSPFAFATPEDPDSDLEDDQDATNYLDAVEGEDRSVALARLAAGTGLSLDALSQFNASGGVFTESGFFEEEGESDEGALSGSALDDIDEIEFLLLCVKEASAFPWWAESVRSDEKNAVEQLMRRHAAIVANGQ